MKISLLPYMVEQCIIWIFNEDIYVDNNVFRMKVHNMYNRPYKYEFVSLPCFFMCFLDGLELSAFCTKNNNNEIKYIHIQGDQVKIRQANYQDVNLSSQIICMSSAMSMLMS